MLRFTRIEIENFAVFERLVVEPSTDPERPLTVIRAENGSGKTTFLRAVVWGMYGENGLPGERRSRYPLQPAWWQPDASGIETSVAIEFENDGSSRHRSDSGPRTRLYRLSRTVRTISRPAEKDDEPDFQRVDEKARLMERELDGTWTPREVGVDLAIKEFLPWELRDFFVMDADQAVDFVGGTESKVVGRGEVEQKTTDAVRSLLGIDVFERAAERLQSTARSLGRKATKAIGDKDLDAMQTELDALEQRRERLEEALRGERASRADLAGRSADVGETLEGEILKIGAYESLVARRQQASRQREAAIERRRTGLENLSRGFESSDLLAPLTLPALRRVFRDLKPLYDSGSIPLRHIAYVRQLLKEGTCVCGRDLRAEEGPRERVTARLAQSVEREEEANYLGELYEATRSLLMAAENSSWLGRERREALNVAVADKEIGDADLDLKDISKKIAGIDEEKVQLLRDEVAAIDAQVRRAERAIADKEQDLVEVTGLLESLGKTVAQRQRNEAVAADSRAAEDVAEVAAAILGRSYESIQERQVDELSDRMNQLFAQMAASVTEEDFKSEGTKASVRVIAEVGIRPVEGRRDRFEIYALSARRRAMAPTEINGASRRVLALSFILALCAESQTHAPLIADSLLNAMSGAVRSNTLRVTVRNSEQPILLLTGSDLESLTEVEIVRRSAGALYTLTGQWDAVDAGKGGEVVNWTRRKNVALLCNCGPREYCSTCERVGQAALEGWKRRTGSEVGS